MKSRNLIFILSMLHLFMFCSLFLNSQNIHPINHETAVELEAVQTPSGSFVAAMMETDSAFSPIYVTVYRSGDNGASWDSVTSIFNTSSGSMNDPVMTIDSSGVISLIFMSMPPKDSWFDCHLRLYQSSDDGFTWQYKGEPYSGADMADYPQIISSGTMKLEMTYTLYTPDSFINYVSSSDGGTTWSSPVTFTAPIGNSSMFQSVGCDLGITGDNALCLAFGDYNHDSIYFSISHDSGLTWQALDTIPGIIKLTVNKMICRKGKNDIGIISHVPHNVLDPLYFSVTHDQGSTWNTQILSDSASYGEGFLDEDGIFHVVYNKFSSSFFKLMYTFSEDGGMTFTEPVVLYKGTFCLPGYIGEYQSLIMAQDQMFHLSFVDLSDSSHTKQIIFAPLLAGIPESYQYILPVIFPNPVQDILNIEFKSETDFYGYELIGFNGNVIQKDYLDIGLTRVEIPEAVKGLLFLRLISPQRTLITKIVRNHK